MSCFVLQDQLQEASNAPPMDHILKDEANFIQNVSQFYNEEALSDIILKVGEAKYYGHKFVLAKSSDVFRTMLYERGWSQNMTEELELSESVECQTVFHKFLRYLYTAEVSISASSAVGILCLADKYNVMSLKELCTKFMVENCRSPKVKNALTWYSWAKVLHLESLIRQCTKTIAWNYHEIISSPEWTNMDLDYIIDTLKSSELVIPNEYALWDALSRWLLHESRVEQLEDNSKKLLPLIRFPQMQVSQLYLLEESELAAQAVVKDLLHNLLSKAYRFRALCPSQSQLGVTFDETFYMPRDYMDQTVDNVRMQNTLRFGIQVDVKMSRGPVPSDVRDADWKITYRKQSDTWQLQLYCHESALVNNEARIQSSVVVYNELENVIQVHREPVCVCTRGQSVNITTTVNEPALARNMAVIIKPVPA